MTRLVLPEDDTPQRLLERSKALAIRRRRLLIGDACCAGRDALDLPCVHDRWGSGCRWSVRAHMSGVCRRVRSQCLDSRDRSGFVDEVDRAVWQPVIAKM